jgi:hypothetical protein
MTPRRDRVNSNSNSDDRELRSSAGAGTRGDETYHRFGVRGVWRSLRPCRSRPVGGAPLLTGLKSGRQNSAKRVVLRLGLVKLLGG